ncbi:unnamed protein product, partial [Iphiclides podalirius]
MEMKPNARLFFDRGLNVVNRTEALRRKRTVANGEVTTTFTAPPPKLVPRDPPPPPLPPVHCPLAPLTAGRYMQIKFYRPNGASGTDTTIVWIEWKLKNKSAIESKTALGTDGKRAADGGPSWGVAPITGPSKIMVSTLFKRFPKNLTLSGATCVRAVDRIKKKKKQRTTGLVRGPNLFAGGAARPIGAGRNKIKLHRLGGAAAGLMHAPLTARTRRAFNNFRTDGARREIESCLRSSAGRGESGATLSSSARHFRRLQFGHDTNDAASPHPTHLVTADPSTQHETRHGGGRGGGGVGESKFMDTSMIRAALLYAEFRQMKRTIRPVVYRNINRLARTTVPGCAADAKPAVYAPFMKIRASNTSACIHTTPLPPVRSTNRARSRETRKQYDRVEAEAVMRDNSVPWRVQRCKIKYERKTAARPPAPARGAKNTRPPCGAAPIKSIKKCQPVPFGTLSLCTRAAPAEGRVNNSTGRGIKFARRKLCRAPRTGRPSNRLPGPPLFLRVPHAPSVVTGHTCWRAALFIARLFSRAVAAGRLWR